MDFGIISHQGMLEKPESRIETKTAIEWENERSEKEAGMTALSSPVTPAQSVLCFDAYGNLTAEEPPLQDAALSSPLSQSYDFSPNFKVSPVEEDDLFIKKLNAISEKSNLKRPKQSKKIRFSDTQLKQVIKEDLPDSISTSTSRYGRERKKRTSDGFLFGTINFNELRKVTACATAIPLSPKEKSSVENTDGVNFDSNPLSKPFDDEIVAPGLAPPEKILTSAESSSETEDLGSGSAIPIEKKKTKKIKKALVSSLPLTENKAVISPSPAKVLQRKLKEDQRYSKLSSPSNKLVRRASKAGDETPDSKRKKASESIFDKGFEKNMTDLDRSKSIEENGRVKESPNNKNERPFSCKRISTFNSDEEIEVNFTPRKKKRRIPDTPPTTPSFGAASLDSPMTDKVTFEDMKPCNGENVGPVFRDTSVESNIDLGTVGDIADDVRLLKDLTEKSKFELSASSEVSVKKPYLDNIASLPSCSEVDNNNSSAVGVKRKRGRPRKNLPVVPHKKIKDTSKKSIAQEELASEFKFSQSPLHEISVDEIKPETEDLEDSILDLSHNSLLALPCCKSVSHTKRGRAVRKPNITDIADLNEMQLQAKKLLKYEKDVAATALDTSSECGPPAELLTELEASHPVEHSLGDVVWVALRGHPLWPAIIIEDADMLHTKLEVKQTVKGFLSHRVYHVLFLNDSLRVYWMREEYLLPFTGRGDMKIHLIDVKKKFNSLKHSDRPFHCLLLKSLSHFHKDAETIQSSPKLLRWSMAVDEAELSAALPREERIQKYTELKKTSIDSVSATSKPKKRKKNKKKELVAAREKKTEPVVSDSSLSRQASPLTEVGRSRRSPSNDSEFSGFDDSSSSEMQKKRKLELIRSCSKENTFDVFYKVKMKSYQKEYPKCNNTELRKVMQQCWAKMGEVKRLEFLKIHLDSFGNSDDALKNKYSSLDELDDQSELTSAATASTTKQGRKSVNEEAGEGARGTYKLPRHEKVCLKCECVSSVSNGSDMVRCKGLCCGTYHYACLGLEVKPDNDKEFRCSECVSGLYKCFICKQGGCLISAKKEPKLKSSAVEKSSTNGAVSETCIKSEAADDDQKLGSLDGDQKLGSLDGKSSVQEKRRRKNSRRKSLSREEKQASKLNLEANEAKPDECNGSKSGLQEKNIEENVTLFKSEPEACEEPENMSGKRTPDQNMDREKMNNDCATTEGPENSDDQHGQVDSTNADETCEKEPNLVDALKDKEDGVVSEVKPASEAGDEHESATLEELQRCSVACCGKFYHVQCALRWPQVAHGWHDGKKLVCPRHMCHMCAATAEDMTCVTARSGSFTRCLRCPATYHTGTDCLAAGSEEISLGSHVCPRHNPQAKSNHLNVTWCFGCSKGGSLVLCDECPAAYHLECLDVPPSPEEGKGFVCDDCINGKVPVYGDIVWAKLGAYRWWPGQVLHPRYIPDNIENLKHTQGMFCVHFFGSNDYYWVHRGRVFHYQDGDRGCKSYQKSSLNRQFEKALEETKVAFEEEQTNKSLREAKRHEKGSNKPPPFVRIDTNKPVGNVKRQELELPPKCDCDLLSASPCGPNSNCINRMLMIECAVEVCGARERCCNQRFQRRQYPQLVPQRVPGRGWGLHTQQDIRAGEFVIEYVGELVDETELWRRIDYMHQINEENYYFLTITKDIIIDAGPKGNLARFMNHSCEPNCETQKWQVGTETRVGLFALCDIPAGCEVTFNYHFECVGTEKKKCSCGSANCSGFIGAKVQKIEPAKKPGGYLKKKKRKKRGLNTKVTEDECFRCGSPGDLILCDLTACPKGYHLSCLGLDVLPRGKWVCPWHHCDECGNRAVTRCFMCPNSFCKAHVEGKMVTTPESVASGGSSSSSSSSLTYCVGHSEQCVMDYCAFSKAQALRAQTEAVRAESPCCQAGAGPAMAVAAAGAAAGAAAPRLQRVQRQAAAARSCKERSERARARRHMRELYNLSELYSEYGSSGLDAVAPQQLLSKLTRDPSASDSERDVELSDHSAAVPTLGRKSSSEREGDADNSVADLAQQLDDTGSGTRRRSKLRGPKSRCKANSNLVLSEDWGGERLVAAEGGREQELESSPVINVVVNLKPRRMSLNHSVEDVHRTCSDEWQGRWTGGSTCDQSPNSKIANNSCAETSVVENYNGKTNKPEYAKTVNESPDQISVSYGEAIKIEDEISYRSSRTRQDNEDWTSDQPCSKISGRALPKSSDTRAVGDQASLCNKSTGFETSTNDVFNSEKCKTASQITNARILNQKQKRTSAVNSFNSLGEEVQCNDDEVQSLRRAADDCNASVKEAISKRDYSSGSQLSGFDERLTSSSGTSEIQCKSMQRNSTLQNSDDFNSTPSDSDQQAVVKNSVPSEGRARLLSLKRRKIINCNGASEGKEGKFSVVADDEDFETKTNMKLSSCVREYQRCIEKSIERHCRGESERNLENSGVQFTLANHTDVGSLPRKSAKPHRSSVNKRAASLCVTADEDSEEEEVQLTVPIVSITM